MNKFFFPYFFLIAFCCFLWNCNQSKKTGETDEEDQSSQLATPQVTEASADEPPSMTFKMKLWEKGVDFYARGNEPSWAVDIDMNKGIKYTTMDGLIIETLSYQLDKAHDENITRISGGADSGDLIITISEEECSDSMSDEKFRNKVVVEIKLDGESEYKTYKGCGQYVPDYSLHDIWELVEANGESFDASRFPDKGSPTFEFYVEEGRVSGHAGCNNFNGGFFRAENDVLHFEPFAMTRMMCPDMELEDLVSKSVAGRRMKYEIKDLKLTMTGYDGTVLVFQKVD